MYPQVTDFPKELPPTQTRPPHMQLYAALVSSRNWEPPSDKAISDYRDKYYPQWVTDVKTWAQGLTTVLNNSVNFFYVRIAMINRGGVPAKTTVIEFQTVPESLLIAPPGEHETSIRGLPRPPTAPTGRIVHWADRFSGMRLDYPFANATRPPFALPNLDINPKRDPHAFYFHPKKPISAENVRAYI